MDIKQLRCFLMAAEFENFTLASDRLNLSQSALSRQIASFEADMGMTLFERSAGGVQLAAEGRRILPRVRLLVEQFDAFEGDFLRRNRPRTRTLGVGLLGSVAQLLVPRLTARFAERRPNLSLQFTEGFSGELEAEILSRRLDYAIVQGDCGPLAGVVRHTAMNDQLYLLTSPNAQTQPEPVLTMAQALALPLVLPTPGARERQILEAEAQSLGVTMLPSRDASSFSMERSLAWSGFGHLLISRSGMLHAMQESPWITSLIEGRTIQWSILTRASQSGAEADLSILEELKDALRQLADIAPPIAA